VQHFLAHRHSCHASATWPLPRLKKSLVLFDLKRALNDAELGLLPQSLSLLTHLASLLVPALTLLSSYFLPPAHPSKNPLMMSHVPDIHLHKSSLDAEFGTLNHDTPLRYAASPSFDRMQYLDRRLSNSGLMTTASGISNGISNDYLDETTIWRNPSASTAESSSSAPSTPLYTRMYFSPMRHSNASEQLLRSSIPGLCDAATLIKWVRA
jgi:hypothetical protein